MLEGDVDTQQELTRHTIRTIVDTLVQVTGYIVVLKRRMGTNLRIQTVIACDGEDIGDLSVDTQLLETDLLQQLLRQYTR